MDIKGKVAIISGAASGIGRATSIAIAQEGARAVAVVDQDEAGLEETCRLVREAGAEALQLAINVLDVPSLERMYTDTHAKFGAIDIVFNNAGIVLGPPPFPDSDLERMRLVIEIDLIAVTQSTALAIRYMREHGGGVVINTGSTGATSPLPTDAPYAGAKAGVVHLSASCAVFNESDGVRVNALSPGVTETPILEHTGGGTRPDWLGPILEGIKVLSPEDIAAGVVRIINDDTIVGQNIIVDNELIAG